MAGDLVSIGSVTVDYRRPQLTFTGRPDSHGIAPCSISGLVLSTEADELFELVNNPWAQVSKGGFTGVQEYVIFSGKLLGKTGYYILQTFDESYDHTMMHTAFTAFSVSAAYLGDLA